MYPQPIPAYPQNFPMIDGEFDRFELNHDLEESLREAESATFYRQRVNRNTVRHRRANVIHAAGDNPGSGRPQIRIGKIFFRIGEMVLGNQSNQKSG